MLVGSLSPCPVLGDPGPLSPYGLPSHPFPTSLSLKWDLPLAWPKSCILLVQLLHPGNRFLSLASLVFVPIHRTIWLTAPAEIRISRGKQFPKGRDVIQKREKKKHKNLPLIKYSKFTLGPLFYFNFTEMFWTCEFEYVNVYLFLLRKRTMSLHQNSLGKTHCSLFWLLFFLKEPNHPLFKHGYLRCSQCD